MKNDYAKYIKETWEMKDAAYADFKKSGFRSYLDFVKADLKGLKIKRRRHKKIAA